jgi:hypothetical protein
MKKEQKIVESFQDYFKNKEENVSKIQEEKNYDLDSKTGQLEFLNNEMDALEKELEFEKDPAKRKEIEQEMEEVGQSIRDLENEEDESVVESFAPQIDKRLEKRQKKSLELKEYKEQAMTIIQGRDYDLYDFEDKMYDAFMRGDDPKQFARDYVLDNEL